MRDAAIDTSRSPARGAAGRSRSSGAPPLDDMVGDGPLSRGAPRRGGITSAAVAAQRLGGGRLGARGRATPGLVARLRGRIPRVRPLKALTVGAFGVALVGIVANAMVFQRGHHPSPLFGLGRSVDGAQDGPARTAAAAPSPAPAEKTGTIAPAPAAPAEPAPPAAAAVQPKPTPIHRAPAKPRHEEAAKAKASEARPLAATHPRPGHPAAKPEAKVEGRTEGKPDAVAKLLAGAAHPKAEAKPADKAAVAAKPEGPSEAKAKAAARPHGRAAAVADGKPAAKTAE